MKLKYSTPKCIKLGNITEKTLGAEIGDFKDGKGQRTNTDKGYGS